MKRTNYIEPQKNSGLPYGLITQGQESQVSWYLITRHYGSDLEATAMYLEDRNSLRRGGGAKRKNTTKTEMDEGTLKKSQQRAKTNLRRKVLSIQGNVMTTLTTRGNITDFDLFNKAFKYFIKLIHMRYGKEFAYVAVPEFQKRGAIHAHMAIHVPKGHRIFWNTWRKLWNRALATIGTDGNVDFSNPEKFGWKSFNPRRLASYLSKYMSKSETVSFNKKRFSSGGLIPLPVVEKGFIAPGLYMAKIFREFFNSMIGKHPEFIWESDGGERGVILAST